MRWEYDLFVISQNYVRIRVAQTDFLYNGFGHDGILLGGPQRERTGGPWEYY
jgi:hypothetical protein